MWLRFSGAKEWVSFFFFFIFPYSASVFYYVIWCGIEWRWREEKKKGRSKNWVKLHNQSTYNTSTVYIYNVCIIRMITWKRLWIAHLIPLYSDNKKPREPPLDAAILWRNCYELKQSLIVRPSKKNTPFKCKNWISLCAVRSFCLLVYMCVFEAGFNMTIKMVVFFSRTDYIARQIHLYGGFRSWA